VRWSTGPNFQDWHPYFAWKRVRIGDQWVWLERVERRLTPDSLDWSEEFRFPQPQAEQETP